MSIFFYGCITLDGYLADKNHGLDWLCQTGTTEETGYADFYRGMDITLMGKRTFLALAQMGDPATVYSTTQNFVFTHTALDQEGFTAVSGDPVDFVKGLEQDKNIWVVGGNTILAPLLEQDMVEHIILQVAPVLLGAGVPLFSQAEGLKRFRLEDVRRYGAFAELVYSKS